MTETLGIRRQPTQARARERVERILAAATALIAETGSDAVRMTEVAERAGVPIGSLYQYFPDKPAILRTLAMRVMERVRDGLRQNLEGLEDAKDAIMRVDATMVGYYDLFLNEPVTRDIWSATQSDKALQELDIEDSRENGRIFSAALKHLVPKRNHARLETASFLLMQLSGSAVRLAIAVGRKEGDRQIAEFRSIMRRELESLLDA
ncbi:TetR/AcrR family transcriptional regulator [Parvibaculum sp.]|jgi:AcrR family transcriptional regulator|uniref:TetR/AcrR family transcriptional regulator n=1 Tax=Parvibaculum sp. TaxID=2024848 RepID=UPI000C55FD87|nr:TetR/AcrR family transcriptional regulator [Parvibaculum sp.]HAC59463.1 TetR family transcriptional regulator [Rhodobiaceae bacterium]MAU61973.1 TetR family transcriptional regulator [Parvibaculum sp.]MBO6666865.1 TetR family transcriptional regulator [Parvibaculum sp.]MBO6691617.1 TetR family transcriptional regulator [Parvibaculum sp.]MBO6713486.1 TetR family transcriptional regulator [Parvibaculum sp.]|tara:strand:- start:16364 stop:16984 length:621 start_codon:yes stop_codon:yes gene_type:complete